MQLKRKKKLELDINVGSFADIAFLLIIFFILTTTFIRPTGRQLEIPTSTNDPEQKEQKQLTITMVPGKIYYGEEAKVLSIAEVREALERQNFAEKSEDDRIVVVESRNNVPYEEWFQVVTAIGKAGGVLGLIEEGKNQQEGTAEGPTAGGTTSGEGAP